MKKKNPILSFKAILLVFILIFSFGEVAAAQWDVGPGQKYATIQSAVSNKNTQSGDIINVHSGTYVGDIRINKSLTIQAITGSNVILKSKYTGFTVLDGGSGTTINGFKIMGFSIMGINITANNCKVENNQITGGKTGITVADNNMAIKNNKISGQSENGILFTNGSGGYSTISGNTISNILGKGPTNGISLVTIGNLTGFKITGNTISNIGSRKNQTAGIGATGMSLFSGGLRDLIISGNVISNLYGFAKATGIGMISLVIMDGKIPNVIASQNKISNINAINGSASGIVIQSLFGNITNLNAEKNTITGINSYGKGSSSIGLNIMGLTLTGLLGKISNFLVLQNNISQINGFGINSTAIGLYTMSMSNGTYLISENKVFKLTAPSNTMGAEVLSLSGSMKLYKNSFTDIKADDTAAGLVAVSSKDLEIIHNQVHGLNGAETVGILAGTNKTVIKGNNIEGNDLGSGVLILGSNSTKLINYNRIVNFKYYIANFNPEFFGTTVNDIITMFDNQIREEIKKQHSKITPEQEAALIKSFNTMISTILDQLIVKNTANAQYNWYGTNDPGNNNFYKGNGTINYNPWLVLNIKANPYTINVGQTSTLTADVYQDSAGGDHSGDAVMFFSGPQLTFSTDLGTVGSKSITVPWVNGMATAILRANEGPGIATVTATDYQSVQTKVTILGGSINPSNGTIGMQDTGVPLNYLLLAVLIVLSGFILPRRK